MNDQDSILSDIQPAEVEGSYFQRVVTNLVDWGIDVLLIVALFLLIPKQTITNIIAINSFSTYIIVFVLMIVYRLICLLVFGKTIGMMLSRLKYLNADLQPLTGKQKLIAVFVVRNSAIRYYKAN